MKHALPLALAAALLASTAAPALAQAPASAAAVRVTPAQTTALLAAIKKEVRDRYVFPDRRDAIIKALDAAQAAGRYAVADPFELASRIGSDLESSSRDKHMGLAWSPPQYAAAVARPTGPADAEDAFWRNEAIRRNSGLVEQKILPGNVRYVKLAAFLWQDDLSPIAYDGAMRFLAGGDAAIIDLRGNGGGDPAAVSYLTSHFLPPDQLLVSFHMGAATPDLSKTATRPAGRITAPLYVLIDGGVASAGEEFAYHVEQFKLGELIGKTTAGAANRNETVPIAPGFMFSISVGRPEHPVSKTNWEGVGVPPAVETAPAKALDVALARALAKLETSAAPADKARYAWARADAAARAEPVALTSPAAAYAGRFGEAAVESSGDQLVLRLPGRLAARLTPLGPDLFAIEDSVRRARFVRNGGAVTGLELLRENGEVKAYPKG
ncbi:S41 family peptidase [Caulobacter sp. 73W]|uniref:S41 family peptidase n=1 Tax=Caulobacter sp. 73W TaxID=3161137 RepID=A0AB39KUV7_9CAUL